ncbi:MAG: hypothetical protein QG623_388 [Patescibacteria group bacterium]|nr:hypothetical protein [Patescibacteria group bacterium]
MNSSSRVKFVVHCPIESGDQIREAIGRAGGGEIGDYSFCSFTIVGNGRSMGNSSAKPVYGEKGVVSSSPEERVEVTVTRDKIKSVIEEVLNVHPYDEPTYDVYPLEDF